MENEITDKRKLEIVSEAIATGKITPAQINYARNIVRMIDNPGTTVDQFDDLYAGFVGGVWCNLGSGKTPELMEGVGPKERHTKDGYRNLFSQLLYNEFKIQTDIDARLIIRMQEIDDAYDADPEKSLAMMRGNMKSGFQHEQNDRRDNKV